MARILKEREAGLLAENAKDMAAAEGNLAPAMLDRLKLTPRRASRPWPWACARWRICRTRWGWVLGSKTLDNGLKLEKVRAPLGVVGIVYESRPNVTVDAAGLCLKSGNACVLRGGSESVHSNVALGAVIRDGLGRGRPAPGLRAAWWPPRTARPWARC